MEYAKEDRRYQEHAPLVVALQHANRIFCPQKDSWMYQDISLREYYQHLGQLGFWAEIVCQCYGFEHNQCYACFELLQYGRAGPGVYCHTAGCGGCDVFKTVRNHFWKVTLEHLPSIQLFRTFLPEYAKPVHRECLMAQRDYNPRQYAAWVRDTYERFG